MNYNAENDALVGMCALTVVIWSCDTMYYYTFSVTTPNKHRISLALLEVEWMKSPHNEF